MSKLMKDVGGYLMLGRAAQKAAGRRHMRSVMVFMISLCPLEGLRDVWYRFYVNRQTRLGFPFWGMSLKLQNQTGRIVG